MPRKKILDAFKNMEKEEKEKNKEKTGAIKKATSEGDKDKAVDNSSTNVVEGVKIPKKRGRKKKIVSESELAVEKIPKKRGRKPKIKPENSEDNPPKVLKKRGRKPKEKYGYVTPVIPDVATDEENIILHLPVNTQMLENERTFSENDILEYNPEIKEPSPWSENSHFQSPFETLTSHNNSKDKSNYDTIPEDHVAENSNVTEDVKLKESVSETIGGGGVNGVNGVGGHDGNGEVAGNGGNSGSLIDQTSGYNPTLEYDLGDKDKIKSLGDVHKFATSDKHKRSFEVKDGSHLLGKQQTFSTLPTFKETNKKREIPTRTSIYCWWCCHSFDNEPCVLPTNLVGTPGNEEFQVTGCFCCPECVAAYNHECYRQHEEREQYSLLNMLYKRFYQSEQIPIKLAPPKMCLRIFGGNLSIEEFRENCHNYYQEFTVIQPPMVSIIPQIEENQANIVLKKQKFIPLDKNRIEKANEDLRLQRSKPLSESINTLENCMRLSYQRDEES